MKTKQFNIKKPNTQYKLNIKYDGYTSNTIIINSRTVFYVKTNGNDTSTDANAGKTWATAFKTIATALGAAAKISPSATNPVEIWVAAGNYNIYKTMAMIKFVSIYGSFKGTETTKNQRTYLTDNTKLKPTTNIINNNMTSTSSSTSRHFTTSLAQATAITPDSVIIDGICFKNAASSSIYNKYSSPTFSNCVWYNNSSSTNTTITAGAVYNSYSSPNFYNCHFISNEATSYMGGAIKYDTGTGNANDISIIKDCIFYKNSSNQDGSAIYANSSNKINITNSIIDTNQTNNNKYGGSIFINNQATVEISDSYIIYNSDLDSIYCGTGVRLKGYVNGSNSATLVANNVTFYKNTCSTKGYTDIDIGRDYYTPNQSPTTVKNRPFIQISNCKLVKYNMLNDANYSFWFNTNDGASSWSNNSEISTNDEANIKANQAKNKIDPSYS